MSTNQPPTEAPEPLEVFTRAKIHPDNLALLERYQELKPLGIGARLVLSVALAWLQLFLRVNRFERLEKKRAALLVDLNRVRDEYQAEKDWIQAFRSVPIAFWVHFEEPDKNEYMQHVKAADDLRQRGQALKRQLADLEKRNGKLFEAAQRTHAIYQRFERNAAITEHWHELKRRRREMEKEAGILEMLLLRGFERNPRCHYVRKENGRERIVTPKFERVSIDADSIYFKVSTASRTIFNKWRNNLPYAVDVKDLVSEETLENLSAVCGRQVEARRNITKTAIFYVVNRLDSPSGLPNLVTYQEMMMYYPDGKRDLLPFPVGVLSSRRYEWGYFAQTPHILVAGFTQSGKSNLVNAIIGGIVEYNTPAECRIVLIDNKGGVEFTHWRHIPHVLGAVVKSINGVVPSLKTLIAEMNRRLSVLEKHQAKDITSFNRKVDEADRLPRIVVFVDEMASLLNAGKTTKAIHHYLAVLTSMGRAVGIHVVLCTQHPSVKVIPPEIKTNMGMRITGRMPSGSASMTVLDNHLAKDLDPVPGRMVVQVGPDPDIVQTPYISDGDIERIVAAAQRHIAPPLELPTPPPVLDDDTEPYTVVIEAPESEETPAPAVETVVAAVIPSKPKLTHDELVRIALTRYEGKLAARKIYNDIRGEFNVTQAGVASMVAEVVKREQIEHEGEIYGFELQRGNYYKLLKREIAPV